MPPASHAEVFEPDARRAGPAEQRERLVDVVEQQVLDVGSGPPLAAVARVQDAARRRGQGADLARDQAAEEPGSRPGGGVIAGVRVSPDLKAAAGAAD